MEASGGERSGRKTNPYPGWIIDSARRAAMHIERAGALSLRVRARRVVVSILAIAICSLPFCFE